jgi:peptidoglycan/xylan/chitin deacetylase (PgdA/CDA1 family)
LRARLLGRVEPLILMYHRVADLGCDPWNLAVTPERFAEQLETLTRQRTIVPLDWLVERLESGHVPEKAVAITFDDGYVDVLRNAKPVLERFGASATAYLTTGAIGRRREFWWDTLSRILLESPALPASLELRIAGRTRTWDVDSATDRGDLHRSVWSALRTLGEEPRAALLAELERWAATAPPARQSDRALDPDEVRELAASDAFTIGAHSISHASLPSLSDDGKRREVGESRSACENLVGRAVASFAYPFGDRDCTTERVVEEAGFRHACSTDPGVAVSIRDRFRLPRVAVENWTGEELTRRLDGIG